jgi:hypothetical protein
MFVRALPAASVAAPIASAAARFLRPVSSETSSYTPNPAEAPVSDPIPKLGALIQSAGEAQYTFDVKLNRDGLMGALAMTTQASGTVTAIDTTAAAGAVSPHPSTACICADAPWHAAFVVCHSGSCTRYPL